MPRVIPIQTLDALAQVPESVLTRLRFALGALAETRDLAAEARAWSGPVMERVILENRAERTREAADTVALFRRMASVNGVDADAVILALGGVPDFAPSPAVVD